jgi:predicted nucleic acid-binding protein
VIAVDSSVWISFFRGRTPVVTKLADLLDRDEVALPIPVRVEILSGARSADRRQLARLLSALPVLYPDPESWKRIDDWVTIGGAAGHRFGFGDLLIAALAADHGYSVWSLDSDFARMAQLGLISVASI